MIPCSIMILKIFQNLCCSGQRVRRSLIHRLEWFSPRMITVRFSSIYTHLVEQKLVRLARVFSHRRFQGSMNCLSQGRLDSEIIWFSSVESLFCVSYSRGRGRRTNADSFQRTNPDGGRLKYLKSEQLRTVDEHPPSATGWNLDGKR